MTDPVLVALVWTLVNAVAFGFNVRGAVIARARLREVEPYNGLAVLQARRNLRVERIRVNCQLCGLAAGALVLANRIGITPPWLVPHVGHVVTLLLIGIAVLLMVDSILDSRHRARLDRAEALVLAAPVMPGGRRAYDPPGPAAEPEPPHG
jgi:hypothetical protein